MKQFFKMFFACFLAVFIASGLATFFLLLVIGGLAASADQKPVVPRDALLVFDLSVSLGDAPETDAAGELVSEVLGRGGPRRLQLRKVIEAIDAAAADARIKGILLHGAFLSEDIASGYGALLELRTALERFRTSGKPLIAYLVTPSTREFLVGSVAGRVVLHPMGMLATPGMSAEIIYWGGLFARYGVGVDVARAGQYKSAGESFSEESMSSEEREQLTELLNDVWGEFVAAVSRSRKLEDGTLQTIVDAQGLIPAEAAQEAGLVDELRDFSDLIGELKQLTGETDPAKSFRQVSMPAYIAARDPDPAAEISGPTIAVVYAEGTIVDGEGAPDNVGGDRLARHLRELRHDPDVKAVVVRVNSPGGSAIASEVIRRELVLVQQEKPVVVSMGSVAASGGYWIAMASDRIYAEPSTITGSIGVIALVPNFQGLAQRFSINVENVKTGRHADIFSIAKPRDAESMQVLQRFVDDTYAKFLDRVVENRKMERAAVEQVAGGRVWSGGDALQRGLIDEIGGLENAIAHAAALAQVKDYTVIDHPAPRGLLEQIMERLSGDPAPTAALVSAPSADGAEGEMLALLQQARELLASFNDPNGLYARMPVLLRLR